MIKSTKVAWVVTASSLCAACWVVPPKKVSILSAYIMYNGEHKRTSEESAEDKNGEEVEIRVVVKGDDVRHIVSDEIYAHIVTYECSSPSQGLSVPPNFQGHSVFSFGNMHDVIKKHKGAPSLELSGYIYRDFLKQIREACVRIEGKNIFGSRVVSNVFKLGSVKDAG